MRIPWYKLSGIICLLLTAGLVDRGFAEAQSPTQPAGKPSITTRARLGAAETDAGATGSSSTVRTTSGRLSTSGTGTKSGVHTIQPAAVGVSVTTTEQPFQPILDTPVEYPEVPEVGEPITLSSPPGGDLPAPQFLEALALATGWNVVASEAVRDTKLRIWVKQITSRQAMEVLKFHNLYYEFDPDTNFLYVMTKDEYLTTTYGTLQQAEFTIRYADILDIDETVKSLLSPMGRLVTDPRTSRVLVWDTEENIRQIKTAVAQLDLPVESRVVQLKHVDATSVENTLAGLISSRGLVQVDPRTNNIVITDLPARQDQIAEVLAALDKELESRTWTLKYADPTVVAEQVAALVPEDMGTVSIQEEVHQVTVTATPQRIAEIDQRIRKWDVKRRQVQIEAYLVTAGSAVARNLGIDWTYFSKSGDFLLQGASPTAYPVTDGAEQSLSIGQLPQAIPLTNWFTGEPVTDMEGNEIIDSFRGNKVNAVIDYLHEQGKLTVLSRPRVTVQDGMEAIFQNTSQEPYVESRETYPTTVTTGTGNIDTILRDKSKITFMDVGIILTVLPRITEDDSILLDISAEESQIIERLDLGTEDEPRLVPVKSQNLTQTQVRVHDAQTIVIGGLRKGTIDHDNRRVPVLGDVPLFGRIFRSTQKNNEQSELLIFLTCSLVDEYTHPEAGRLAQLDQDLQQSQRQYEKPLWERIDHKLRDNKNEIPVSIGQGGDMFSNGEHVSLDDLRRKFAEVPMPKTTTVVIRRHPMAPERTAMEVTEAAMEADLKVETEDTIPPFVPTYRETPSNSQEQP